MFGRVTFEHNVSYNPNHSLMLLDLQCVLKHLMVRIVFYMINKFVVKILLKNLNKIVQNTEEVNHHVLFLK